MKLRIAMVGACPYPAPQGSQVLMRNTADCFHRLGHDVHLVVYGYGAAPERDPWAVHRAARIPFASKTAPGPSLMKPLQDVTLAMALRRTVRRQHIDVVCAHNYEALLAALLVGKRPILYFAHNSMAEELPYFLGGEWATGRVGCLLDKYFPCRADKIIVPHHRLAGHLVVRGCRQEQVVIVPPPLDGTPFRTVPVDSASVPAVIYAGNVDAYQNLPLLLAAVEILKRKKPDVKLLIGTAARACIHGAEIVPVHDLEGLSRFLARDAVFAVPRVSWSGYPMKILNAMAAGKAVVACESAAYPLAHEETGLVVPDDNVDAYAAALLRLVEDPHLREKLGAQARHVVLERHQPDVVARQLETLMLEAHDRYTTRIHKA
ncbi:MAG: GDP-mannose-dependent alpha-(1-2)-phosphatidylinositol mannosyltransferase [Candidatus Hydrogenedentes bacterium ADurb.Bin179]|nr:MAG: GDP-mannose-dependent alpha-(1-2)-phosphatidylinositol mannosyltransferase [Candidatus Hydrogenedentes bacterium ADurb.Bin179]